MSNKKIIIIFCAVIAVVAGLFVLKGAYGSYAPSWNQSLGTWWFLPMITGTALLDSVNPCAFSVLLITIAFLFSLGQTRKKILLVGGAYIFGIFLTYVFIGLGILRALTLFNIPHFMGKVGAVLLVGWGLLEIVNVAFPGFPIRLKIPKAADGAIAKLINKVSYPAAVILGIFVGLTEFPCAGGPVSYDIRAVPRPFDLSLRAFVSFFLQYNFCASACRDTCRRVQESFA